MDEIQVGKTRRRRALEQRRLKFERLELRHSLSGFLPVMDGALPFFDDPSLWFFAEDGQASDLGEETPLAISSEIQPGTDSAFTNASSDVVVLALDAVFAEKSTIGQSLIPQEKTSGDRHDEVVISSQHILDFIQASVASDMTYDQTSCDPEYCQSFDHWAAQLASGEEVLDVSATRWGVDQ
jgi:hypothetical protein